MNKDEIRTESNLMNPYNGFTSHGNDEKPDITAAQLATNNVSVIVLNSKEEDATDRK